MKQTWFALPIIALFTAAFVAVKLDDSGRIPVGRLQGAIAPVHRISAAVTDLKFRLRGPVAPRQRIVIVEIDSPSLGLLGRWPWHRDTVAKLIDSIFDAGAQVVGLDAVFAEPDPRTPAGLRRALEERGLAELAGSFETDPVLVETIRRHADRLVLGWMTDSPCQPALEPMDACPVTDAVRWSSIPRRHQRFALRDVTWAQRLQAQKTPLPSAVTVTQNHDLFLEVARHAGALNALLDADGVVRRSNLVVLAAGKPHPSLPLAMARVAWADDLSLKVDADGRIASLARRSGAPLPVSDLGQMRVRFLGPGRTFPYVAAHRVIAGEAAARALLRDAHVLVGVSALGAHDIRSFPFDANVPGVEGHATVLENLLDGSALLPAATTHELPILLLLMTVGALLLTLALARLPALPGIATFLAVTLALALGDFTILFTRRVLFDSGLFYLELALLLGVSLAVRYLDEERKKRFIRTAFSRYVPPAVVDSILAHPEQLALGGERKSLSILFSDIRGFTTLSERLEPRALVSFLNEYLGRMTGIVFQHQGTLDKYIGDAVMAFWGAPLPQPDHARRALAAACDMLRAVDEMRPAVKQRFGIDLEIGLGVASGPVSVGNMGSPENFEYTAIGDRVNLASRLESLTKTYGARILTTTETLDEIRATGQPLPPARTIDLVRVKGKREAVELVEVLEAPPGEEERGFTEARRLYLERRFAEARAAFEALARNKPAKLLVLLGERCTWFERHPPPEDWRGEWEMESK